MAVVGTDGVYISIHAPRAGSDRFNHVSPEQMADFNPRSPCGERRLFVLHFFKRRFISIHAPRAGSDGFIIPRYRVIVISIHAPRAGSDLPFCLRDQRLDIISIHAPRAGSDGFDYKYIILG